MPLWIQFFVFPFIVAALFYCHLLLFSFCSVFLSCRDLLFRSWSLNYFSIVSTVLCFQGFFSLPKKLVLGFFVIGERAFVRFAVLHFSYFCFIFKTELYFLFYLQSCRKNILPFSPCAILHTNCEFAAKHWPMLEILSNSSQNDCM